jgi:hypothetical protein
MSRFIRESLTRAVTYREAQLSRGEKARITEEESPK